MKKQFLYIKSLVTASTYDVSILSLQTITITIILSAIFLLFKAPINGIIVPLSLLLSIIIYMCTKNKLTKEKKINICIFLFLFLLGCLLSTLLYDMTWDGNSYHKQAIGALGNGWNPVYESLDTHLQSLGLSNKVFSYAIWNDHYAKGYWLFSAALYKITGSIETGKVLTIIMAFSSFSIIYKYLKTKNSWFLEKEARRLSALISFNPITFVQLFSYYNDGVLASGLFMLIITLFSFLDPEYKENMTNRWIIIGCNIIILSSVKFTGLAYAGVFCVLFYVLSIFLETDKRKKREKAKKQFLLFTTVFVVAVFVVGSSSYVKNIVDHKNPFYPLMGAGSADIMTSNSPQAFEEMGNAEKIFYSTFSRSEHITKKSGEEPKLKMPFTVYPSEFLYSGSVDLRLGGFGPLFSGILCVSFPIIIWLLFHLFKKNRPIFWILLTTIALIFVLLFSVPDSEWARYSPFVYLLPTFSLAFLYYISKKSESTFWKKLANLFGIILIINTLFFSTAMGKNVIGSAFVSHQKTEIQQTAAKTEGPLQIALSSDFNYSGVLYNVDDLGIDYEIVDKIAGETNNYYLWSINYPSDKADGTFEKFIKTLM